jgi:hypothetical protein
MVTAGFSQQTVLAFIRQTASRNDEPCDFVDEALIRHMPRKGK